MSGDVKRLDRHRLDADSETTDLLVAWNSVLRNNTPNEQTDYYGDYQRHQDDVQDQHDALPVRAVAQRRNLSFGLAPVQRLGPTTTGSQPPVKFLQSRISLIHPCARRVYSAGAI